MSTFVKRESTRSWQEASTSQYACQKASFRKQGRSFEFFIFDWGVSTLPFAFLRYHIICMRSSRGPRYPKHVLTGEHEINPEILQARARRFTYLCAPERSIRREAHTPCNSHNAMNYRRPADRAEGSRESLESSITRISNNKLWYTHDARYIARVLVREILRDRFLARIEELFRSREVSRKNDSLILTMRDTIVCLRKYRKYRGLYLCLWLLW